MIFLLKNYLKDMNLCFGRLFEFTPFTCMFHAGSKVCLSSVFSFYLWKQIIPQSVCSRYGLAIGAAVAPVVRVLVFICFPVAYPISKVRYAEHIIHLCQLYVANYY